MEEEEEGEEGEGEEKKSTPVAVRPDVDALLGPIMSAFSEGLLVGRRRPWAEQPGGWLTRREQSGRRDRNEGAKDKTRQTRSTRAENRDRGTSSLVEDEMERRARDEARWRAAESAVSQRKSPD